MANRVEYAVSATPVRTIAGVTGKYAAQDVIGKLGINDPVMDISMKLENVA